MATFGIEDFLGEGVLRSLLPKLTEDGWDDVPTIKMIKNEDMELMHFTATQKDALELRIYLHDRALMIYADKLEASGKSIAELQTTSITILSSQFGMKKGDVARFLDKKPPTKVQKPVPHSLHKKPKSIYSFSKSDSSSSFDDSSISKQKNVSRPLLHRKSEPLDTSMEQTVADSTDEEAYMFKGIVAAEPGTPRFFGCISAPHVEDDVAPYSSIEKISVQRLVPEYKYGVERSAISKATYTRASDLWKDKPVILLCIRRPGCIMCRAEAHQIYSRKPAFDELGFQLIAVLHEQIDKEVKDFWPRYWGGSVVLDPSLGFFKALGGGELMKEKFITGFLFNPRSLSNYRRAKATGFKMNHVGQGEIKGGLFVIGRGRTGIAYQFIERNFGDWAPIFEVLEICSQMQEEFQSLKPVTEGI